MSSIRILAGSGSSGQKRRPEKVSMQPSDESTRKVEHALCGPHNSPAARRAKGGLARTHPAAVTRKVPFRVPRVCPDGSLCGGEVLRFAFRRVPALQVPRIVSKPGDARGHLLALKRFGGLGVPEHV